MTAAATAQLERELEDRIAKKDYFIIDPRKLDEETQQKLDAISEMLGKRAEKSGYVAGIKVTRLPGWFKMKDYKHYFLISVKQEETPRPTGGIAISYSKNKKEYEKDKAEIIAQYPEAAEYWVEAPSYAESGWLGISYVKLPEAPAAA